MGITDTVHAGADDAFIAWNADFITECRGFALYRRIKRAAGGTASPNTISTAADGTTEEIVASWVGFADGPEVEPGTRQPTTVWPIQKYLWSDFAVGAGDEVAYRVVPMTGPWNALVPADALASAWSDSVVIGPRAEDTVSCYFNRGIVASQWVARQLPSLPDPKADTHAKNDELRKSIATPGNVIRDFLSGGVRIEMIRLLQAANAAGGHVYLALFELDDPELLPLLSAFGKRAHIVLGNGSVKHKGDDENDDARLELKATCDVRDRFSAPRALAHNKFMAICDSAGHGEAVFTGSTNWTRTGLCTQANNGILLKSPALAAEYVTQWKRLAAAGDETPDTLREADGKPKPTGIEGVTLWFTPMTEALDLEQAGALIRGAKQGILFAMFNPGPRGTLLDDIIQLASPSGANFKPDLYIQGVLNQNPGTDAHPVTLFNRGDRIEANADVVLPAAINQRLKFWVVELQKLAGTFAMVHSKVVVIDPYGDRPVVMTGSHNMGPKASGTNDENFLIIEGNGRLASQYASKIMEIYNQYRWRASQAHSTTAPRWAGLANDDRWQIGAPGADARTQAYDGRRRRELDFWFGR